MHSHKLTKIFPGLAVLALATLVSAFSARAVEKAAVFPFDLRDIGQEGEVVPQLEPEDLRRLKVVAEELKALMQKDGRYEAVDLAAYAGEIDQAAPLVSCDGCEAPIAAKAGADLAVTGQAEKWSDSLISLRLFVRDAKSGQMKNAMSAEIRGNTDDLWLHALRWLWRNRFVPQEKASESK